MRARREKLGTTLVALGLMSEHQMRTRLADQVRGIIHSLFTWNEGVFRFQQESSVVETGVVLDLPTVPIILEGTRLMEPEAVRAAVGDVGRVATYTKDPRVIAHYANLTLKKGSCSRESMGRLRSPTSFRCRRWTKWKRFDASMGCWRAASSKWAKRRAERSHHRCRSDKIRSRSFTSRLCVRWRSRSAAPEDGVDRRRASHSGRHRREAPVAIDRHVLRLARSAPDRCTERAQESVHDAHQEIPPRPAPPRDRS